MSDSEKDMESVISDMVGSSGDADTSNVYSNESFQGDPPKKPSDSD